MKLIERRQYLNKLINVLGTPDIKVVTGATLFRLILIYRIMMTC